MRHIKWHFIIIFQILIHSTNFQRNCNARENFHIFHWNIFPHFLSFNFNSNAKCNFNLIEFYVERNEQKMRHIKSISSHFKKHNYSVNEMKSCHHNNHMWHFWKKKRFCEIRASCVRLFMCYYCIFYFSYASAKQILRFTLFYSSILQISFFIACVQFRLIVRNIEMVWNLNGPSNGLKKSKSTTFLIEFAWSW